MTRRLPSRGFRRPIDRNSRDLVAFGGDDLSSVLPTGQTLAFARAGSQTVLDSAGRLLTLAAGELPFGCAYNATEGVFEPGLDINGFGHTNVCLRSEDFSNWTDIGTPTLTSGAKRCGDLVLDLLGDDAAGTLEGKKRVVAFTANAVKAIGIRVAQGTSTSSVIRLRDTTAGANRLLMAITWSAGVPAVAATTGSYLGKTRMFDGTWALFFQATSVTAANNNELEVYPATNAALTVASTGTLYVGGVQAENATACGSYVKTTTASATDVIADASVTIAFPPQDLTIYVRHAVPWWASATVLTVPFTILTLGDDTGVNYLRVRYEYASGWKVKCDYEDAAGSVGTVQAVTATPESTADFVIQLNNALSAARVRIDVGGGLGSYGTVLAAYGAAWSNALLSIGDTPAGGAGFHGVIRRLRIAPGAKTLTEMRGIVV